MPYQASIDSEPNWHREIDPASFRFRIDFDIFWHIYIYIYVFISAFHWRAYAKIQKYKIQNTHTQTNTPQHINIVHECKKYTCNCNGLRHDKYNLTPASEHLYPSYNLIWLSYQVTKRLPRPSRCHPTRGCITAPDWLTALLSANQKPRHNPLPANTDPITEIS